MKYLVLICLAFMISCGSGTKINARSLKTVNKSVSFIKDRLPEAERLQFEIAFWMVRDDIRNNDEFLKTVDGKKPVDLIAMGKDIFTKRKAAGDQEYAKYETWEQMITGWYQQRQIEMAKAKERTDKRDNDKVRRIDYNMHSL